MVCDVIALIETEDSIVKVYKVIGRVILAGHIATNVMIVVVISHPKEKHDPGEQEKSYKPGGV